MTKDEGGCSLGTGEKRLQKDDVFVEDAVQSVLVYRYARTNKVSLEKVQPHTPLPNPILYLCHITFIAGHGPCRAP